MKRIQTFKKAVLSAVLIAAILIPMVTAALQDHSLQAKETAARYRNSVFTENLYQKTKKIAFDTDTAAVIKDSQTVTKVYRLLAKMELKALKNTEKAKPGAVTLVIYKKDGSKKTCYFQNGRMTTGKKSYQITKNDPLLKLQEIFYPKADHAVVKAVYPKMSPYPDENDYINAKGEFDDDAYSKAYDAWWTDISSRRQITGYADGLDAFFAKSTKEFLSGAGEENRIYSPLNVYMALGMLAEITDGNSRQQILDLLGSKDIQALRRQASDLWNANYRNDVAVTSILASSLWLNEDTDYKQDAMESLAKNYYASSFKGKMGSDEFNKLLQEWLDEQTGGLLKEQASLEELNPDTVLALASTIYFRARWHHEFLKDLTKEEIFHAESGDRTCEFMNKTKSEEAYYWGDHFSAAAQALEGSGSMWFLLPNEGVKPEELLNDSQAMDFLTRTDKSTWENQKQVMMNLSVPKFDVSSRFELKEGLQALGVTDVFDEAVSDFSPMTADAEGLFVSKASHAARVAADEEGVTAAAYTVIGVDATAALVTDEEIDFVLDRPFLFVLTGSDGLPLFAGVVNQP